MKSPSNSSMAPPSSKSAPNLRPRTPTKPRPGFVLPSPDSRVSVKRPSTALHSEPELSVYEVSSDDSESESDAQAVVKVTEDINVSKKKKKKKPRRSKVHAPSRDNGKKARNSTTIVSVFANNIIALIID